MKIIRGVPNIKAASDLAAAAFGRVNDQQYQKHVADVLIGTEVWCAVDTDTAELLGFISITPYPDLLYVNATAVSVSSHGSHIFGRLLAAAYRAFPTEIVGLRTQSVRMYQAMVRYCQEAFPGYNELPKSELVEKAYWLANLKGHDEPHAPGCYKGSLFGTKPASSNPELQAWWDSLCDFRAGDAHYCVGRLNPSTLKGLS